MKIQEYLIAAIQNIQVLLRYGEQPKKSLLAKVNQIIGRIQGVMQPIFGMIKGLMAMAKRDYVTAHRPCWFCKNSKFGSKDSSKKRFEQQPVEA